MDFYSTVENPYVEGVVVTRGTVKQLVRTFGASFSSSHCPCSSLINAPPFVGDDYFCENSGGDLRLWDGENCDGACCDFNDPPFFCTSFSDPTTDDIEIAICAGSPTANEDTPIELIEIFVQ